MLFLDPSSAFDTVDHDIMLSILHRRFSFEGAALNWFHSDQTDHSQTFSVGDSNSDPHSVNCSVPQGSVLGPVEFVADTEDVVDLFDRHKVNHHMYADDQHIYISTCTPYLTWHLKLLRVWLAASLTFLVGVLPDDYHNLTP